jgi:ribosome biogenesis protein BMS1
MGIYKLGSYVKMTIKGIKHKFIKNFTPDIPLILSRINPGEDQLGFVKIRIKKHRWYNTILKTSNPLIFSMGWRRF